MFDNLLERGGGSTNSGLPVHSNVRFKQVLFSGGVINGGSPFRSEKLQTESNPKKSSVVLETVHESYSAKKVPAARNIS